MSERYCAWIKIGGKVPRPKVKRLLKAITEAGVSLEWGDALFAPTSPDELLDARKDGRLWLSDDQASWGEFPELEQVCRKLRLAYTRCCDGCVAYDAQRVEWRPGMKEPTANKASYEHPDEILIPASEAREAIALLEAGKMQRGIDRLKALCPDIPDLPPFEIA